MLFRASSRYVRVSPYKLRLYADVVRGNSVDKALAWLKMCRVKMVEPVEKLVYSAYSNAKNLQKDIGMENLYIKEIVVDQGPIIKYSKPSAMGRAAAQRKRLSHIKIVLESK
ncbi:TPA: 50S ribosomal protein L22 [Candidatus Dependentiae bacterium]|nr:MAG: 50S ribosomal protein L22 [candidate division TM6 bacterium GW2011_GWE2_31_21]KKP53122.1 MAG: 50S ribosomal protein L22 [candidate division TM6 bacterium GW2011_GWF2_33_332]HBS47941.1 50S ribosomal protein L22 [Candidatus Dependentiae bacterium]HBZ73455.1 50S ribosomal protein L22 [Candidatus Dependentiae bacterium]